MTTTNPPYPISNRKAKLSLIHIAKKDTGITDDAYRAILNGAANVDSAAQILYEYQFNAVMKAFENLGFKSSSPYFPRPRWKDYWGCTSGQRAKIELMWKEYARNPSERALRAFIKRIVHVDHPRFLNAELARKVIIALEAMAKSASGKKDKTKCSS